MAIQPSQFDGPAGLQANDMSVHPVLAVIPARGGSRGLPGKNIATLAGLPLIAHSIRLSNLCSEIVRCLVSTDSDEIAAVARDYGGEVPFLRPAELARDDTPMWPVIRHALTEMEARDRVRYGSVLLLAPTSPGRLPEDVSNAIRLLEEDSSAVGVVAASKPSFNPRWVCIDVAGDGYMRQSFPDGNNYVRRQDVPAVYRINGALYLWRRDHIATSEAPCYFTASHRILEIPESRAIDIDSLHDLRLADLILREGLVRFPWLGTSA
jgi:CMP-N,N'-diacetyllegionaminic acid synthase